MTEKVVSLSGGLVLGMVFALLLGIGATQNLAPSLHFEMPAILRMTIAQVTHPNSTTANDTTPNVDATPPSEEDRGRITRIASLAETTDPVFETTASTSQPEPKTWNIASTSKIDNSLQMANLQRTYLIENSDGTTYSSVVQAASQSNFAAIAGNSSGRQGYGSGQSPSFIDGKPQSQGSPAMAQNDPDPEGEGPSLTGKVTTPPGPSPDSMSNSQREPIDMQAHDHRIYPDYEPGNPGDPRLSAGRNRHRPETD